MKISVVTNSGVDDSIWLIEIKTESPQGSSYISYYFNIKGQVTEMSYREYYLNQVLKLREAYYPKHSNINNLSKEQRSRLR